MFDWFVDLYKNAPAWLQLLFLLVMLGLFVFAAYRLAREHGKKEQLRDERDAARKECDELQRDLAAAQAVAEQTAAERDRSGDELRRRTEELGRVTEQRERASQDLEEVHRLLERTTTERDALAKRFDDLQRIDADVWSVRGEGLDQFPPFTSRSGRRARFVTFINLKGGVGKTTLVANLAAAYATGVTGKPLQVLIIDLDYQGTLSDRCVNQHLLKDRRNPAARRTADLLILEQQVARGADALLAELMVQVSGTDDRCKAIVAEEHLDHVDFRQQALFVAQRREVRFFHRQILHDSAAAREFDFVFFDCPPRLTTSSVNALLASDYVVIPTSLDPNDIEAVPRTLRWLEKLAAGQITYQAQLAALIINSTYRANTVKELTSQERQAHGRLEVLVQAFVPTGNAILSNTVRSSSEVARFAAGSLPLGASDIGHTIYGEVAKELFARIRI